MSRAFNLKVACVAIAGFAIFYFEIRTPGTLGVLGFLAGSLFLLVAMLVALVQIVRHGPTSRWRAFAAVAAIPLAVVLGRQEGLRARDSRFLDWRLPVYSKVVERVLADRTAERVGADSIEIELTAEERAVAMSAKIWPGASSKPVIQFLWAATGPPPKHFYYVHVTAERNGASETTSWHGRRVAPGWYEFHD